MQIWAYLISDIDAVELRKGKPSVNKIVNVSGGGGKDIVHKLIQHVGPPTSAKPSLPVKPLHIRPGLKPVKIPTVDDKLLVSFIFQ